MQWLIENTTKPKPRLNLDNKDEKYVCPTSALPPPFNQCRTGLCRHQTKNSKLSLERHHIDLNQPTWKVLNETVWLPFCEWVRENNKIIGPSDEFVVKTPTFKW